MEQDASSEAMFLAKYPFLRNARTYVAAKNISFDELLKHPVWCASLELGRRRVVESMEGRFKPDFGDDVGAQLTIISYPLARMLAQSLGKAASAKYAEGEADAAYRLLKDEREGYRKAVVDDLDLKVEEDRMPLVVYTRLASALARHNPKWKLTNRVVDGGWVEVEPDEVTALSREAIRNRVLEPIDLKKMPDEVKKVAAGLKVALSGDKATLEMESLEDEAMPPCMRGMIAALEAGVASHNAMFILATFLNNLGLKKPDMLKVFSKSPKYDEEKTTYQLEFLTGEKGGTEYTCPTCATIKSHGLCKAECEVKHPLQYYRRHAKKKPKLIKKEKK